MRPQYFRTLRASSALGLFLMRVALAVTIVSRRPWTHFSEVIAAVLLLSGAWTPVVSAFIAAVELWRAFAHAGGWASLLLATMAVALALIGSGRWSVDARFFGWRRIDIPETRKW